MYYVLRSETFSWQHSYFARDAVSDGGLQGLAESRDDAETFDSPQDALIALQRFYIEGSVGERSQSHLANFDIVKVRTEIIEEVVE